ncbi:hypothetical protein F5B17DRAFT_450340 [Nemania serpens]|nr:hypothetical protein F5B17DRAFT_450340 [Nemania serpens]
MKRPAVPCSSPRDRSSLRLAPHEQSLDGAIRLSESCLPLGSDGDNLTDAFDLALEWSAVAGAIRGEDKLPCTQQNSLPEQASDVSSRSVSISSIGNEATTSAQENKRLSLSEHRSGRQTRREGGNPTYLPLEIMATIISKVITTRSICALNLVVPDWKLCDAKTHQLGESPGTTRIVTYIQGVRFQVGVLFYASGCVHNDHVLTPSVDFDPDAVLVSRAFSSEYTREFYRSNTHVFNLGMGDSTSDAVQAVLGDWRNLQPLRGQRLRAILPFDDEETDIVEKRAGLTPNPVYQHFRHIVVHSPLELMLLNAENFGVPEGSGSQSESDDISNALDLDRSAHLWLSWSQMPKLESLYLDLRIYSHDLNTERRCLSRSQVIDRAREMGRHLQLSVSVLAGLQSYSFNVAYKGITAQDVEKWDEISGEPNWIKIFTLVI